MEICRITDGGIFQTVVVRLEHPTLPPVLLVGENHMGSHDYFKAITEQLTPNEPGWVGYEQLLPNPKGLKLTIRERMRLWIVGGVMEKYLSCREQLTNLAGITTRGQVESIPNAENIDVPKYVLALAWTQADIKRLHGTNQRLGELLKAAKRDGSESLAANMCRQELKRMTEGGLSANNQAYQDQEFRADEAGRDSRFYGFVKKALAAGLPVRLCMGAVHVAVMTRRLLENDGYTIKETSWLDCIDLTQL